MADPFAIAAIAAMAIGTGVQVHSSMKAASAAKRRARLEFGEQKLSAVREARARRAAIIAGQANQGGTSSSAIGAVGSVQSQAARTTGVLNQQFQASRQIANAQTLGAIGQGVSAIGGSMASFRKPAQPGNEQVTPT
jgi:hypothetical protein